MGVGLLHNRDRSACHDVSICSHAVKTVEADNAKQHFHRHRSHTYNPDLCDLCKSVILEKIYKQII